MTGGADANQRLFARQRGPDCSSPSRGPQHESFTDCSYPGSLIDGRVFTAERA
jgi:hypothetical protein